MKPLLLAFLAACASTPDAGTSVGNPGDASLTAAPSAGVSIDAARWTVDTLTWTGCDRGEVHQEIDAELDLGGDGAQIDLPRGEWCAAELRASGPLQIAAPTERGGELRIELELDEVLFVASHPVSSAEPGVRLELGPPGWLTSLAAQTGAGERTEVRPGDPEHDRLVHLIEARSRLLQADEDGGAEESNEDHRGEPIADLGGPPEHAGVAGGPDAGRGRGLGLDRGGGRAVASGTARGAAAEETTDTGAACPVHAGCAHACPEPPATDAACCCADGAHGAGEADTGGGADVHDEGEDHDHDHDHDDDE